MADVAFGCFERDAMMLISMMSLMVAGSMGDYGRWMTMWPDDVGSPIG